MADFMSAPSVTPYVSNESLYSPDPFAVAFNYLAQSQNRRGLRQYDDLLRDILGAQSEAAATEAANERYGTNLDALVTGRDLNPLFATDLSHVLGNEGLIPQRSEAGQQLLTVHDAARAYGPSAENFERFGAGAESFNDAGIAFSPFNDPNLSTILGGTGMVASAHSPRGFAAPGSGSGSDLDPPQYSYTLTPLGGGSDTLEVQWEGTLPPEEEAARVNTLVRTGLMRSGWPEHISAHDRLVAGNNLPVSAGNGPPAEDGQTSIVVTYLDGESGDYRSVRYVNNGAIEVVGAVPGPNVTEIPASPPYPPSPSYTPGSGETLPFDF